MNSQNRMNAGAEYVLYRIWATLQDQDGIHPESLLTCVGALAGYACQVCVRQNAALPGADPDRYVLRAIETGDGTTYLYGDALNVPLAESPLSIWSLVSRTVEKLGKAPPDFESIVRHVTESVGTSAFGVPRNPDGPRSRHAAIVYLKQVWPQILPIAQRFCSKPMQIPVLFGIALQRAIEHTKDMLSPTISASIAMECAVAMSKVVLPGDHDEPMFARPAAVASDVNAALMPTAAPARGKGAESAPSRAAPSRKRRRVSAVDEQGPGALARIASLPLAARIVAIASLAFITIAGAMYQPDRSEAPAVAREKRVLLSQSPLEDSRVLEQPIEEEAQPSEELPPPEQAEVTATSLAPEDAPDSLVSTNGPPPFDPSADGSAEIVMRDDSGQPMN